jgi:valyl-tRNA synthetase
VLPFVTEEVWSWWEDGSVHRAAWPSRDEVAALAGDGDPQVLRDASAVLTLVRKAKSEAKVSMRADVERAVVRGPRAQLDRVALSADDLRATGRIGELELAEGDSLDADVELAEAGAA